MAMSRVDVGKAPTSASETEQPDKVRVFLVDDHAVVREGTRALLEHADDIEVVGSAGTAREGLQGLLATRPDVALVDVRLPDGNGIEVVREVRSRFPKLPCIMFTSFADDEAFFHAVVAGSVGYLVKDAGGDELTRAVRTVAKGGSLVSREVIDDLRRRAAPAAADNELLSSLSGQEQRILKMVAEGLTNREIATELKLAEKTVRNYVSNILSKVGMRNRTQLAAYVAMLSARRWNGQR